MLKWGNEEETNIPLFSLMRKIFIVQFHSLIKCSLIFTMGNILSQVGFHKTMSKYLLLKCHISLMISRKFHNLFSEIFHFRNIPTKMIQNKGVEHVH